MTTIRQDHICFNCQRYLGGTTCKAFDDIPEEIWESNNHSQEVEGDKGYRYLPKDLPKGKKINNRQQSHK